MPPAPTRAYAGLALATVGWAAAFIAGKLALAEMTPLTVAAWRYALAAVVLVPFAVRPALRARLRPVAAPLALMVACGGVLYPWLFLTALATTTATNTAFLVALNPALTVLLAPLVGETQGGRRLAGVGLALAGAATVITRGDLALLGSLGSGSGDLFAVAAAGVWATFNLTARTVAPRLSAAVTSLLIYGIGAALLGLLAWPEAPLRQLGAASPVALGGLVAMAVCTSVSAQLYLVGVRTVGIGRTVVFVYVVPVLTAGLAALLLGEQLGLAQVVGGVAVLAGVAWTTAGPPIPSPRPAAVAASGRPAGR